MKKTELIQKCVILRAFDRKIQKKAFTLAEVLITLAIIGVVAAMSIPALKKNLDDMQWKSQYKKSYAEMSQFVYEASIENEFTPRTQKLDETVTNANWEVLKKYFGISKLCESNNNSECWDANGEKLLDKPNETFKAFIDKSGKAWSIYNYTENIIIVDVNGFKGPNWYGRDRWIFTYGDKNNFRIATSHSSERLPKKVIPYRGKDDALPADQLTSIWTCGHPPCYYRSWLLE